MVRARFGHAALASLTIAALTAAILPLGVPASAQEQPAPTISAELIAPITHYSVDLPSGLTLIETYWDAKIPCGKFDYPPSRFNQDLDASWSHPNAEPGAPNSADTCPHQSPDHGGEITVWVAATRQDGSDVTFDCSWQGSLGGPAKPCVPRTAPYCSEAAPEPFIDPAGKPIVVGGNGTDFTVSFPAGEHTLCTYPGEVDRATFIGILERQRVRVEMAGLPTNVVYHYTGEGISLEVVGDGSNGSVNVAPAGDKIEGIPATKTVLTSDGVVLVFSDVAADVHLDLGGGNDDVRLEGEDAGPKRLMRDAGADVAPWTISGGNGADRISGAGGKGRADDFPRPLMLRGGAGNDRLEGGKKSDTLNGSRGTDTCVGSNADVEKGCER